MKELKVQPIRNGTVIDHIAPGRALQVLRILGLPRDGHASTITAAMHVPTSQGPGRKDILKIEDRELDPDEVNKVALISPGATINIVREFNVTRKTKVQLPPVIHGIVKCPNPNCITNAEPAAASFAVAKADPVTLQCEFCDRVVREPTAFIRA